MVSKILPTVIILFTTFTTPEFARIRLDEVKERVKFETQAQIVAWSNEEDTEKSVVEAKSEKPFEVAATSAADGTEADSAGVPVKSLEFSSALVQEAVAQGSVFWQFSSLDNVAPDETPSWELLPMLPLLTKQLGVAPDVTPSSFSKTLAHLKSASHIPVNRLTILRAACDSSAFSCEEIIQLANHCWRGPSLWQDAVMVFARGRNNTGCISDPANAKIIVDFFDRKWPDAPPGLQAFIELKPAFIDNNNSTPAKGVGPLPMQLQTGLRTDKDMQILLRDIEAMQRSNAYGSQGPDGLYEPGTPSVIESWLKQIRAHGEQFSGPQLVTLVNAIPKNSWSPQAVSTLLQSLKQYVTGVTCKEVIQILQQIDVSTLSRFWLASLDALQPNIVDGQNKVDIVAFADSISSAGFLERPLISRLFFVRETAEALTDVGVGLPPKNNPIFGVVEGNPVILVVDESTSMDLNLTLGNDTVTRRKFCHSQLETVLEGLPNDIYFNVIQYSSSAVKIFEKAVLVSRANIDAAMEAMGTTWRGDYAPGQDPLAMLQKIKVFALKFKHLKRSAKRDASEALRLAYATAYLPSQQGRRALVAAKDLPQIYFLTSGQPDGGARQILDNIREFDNGRNIPVNSIGFIMPADPVVKRFVKDLANQTGGFFRSIE